MTPTQASAQEHRLTIRSPLMVTLRVYRRPQFFFRLSGKDQP